MSIHLGRVSVPVTHSIVIPEQTFDTFLQSGIHNITFTVFDGQRSATTMRQDIINVPPTIQIISHPEFPFELNSSEPQSFTCQVPDGNGDPLTLVFR
jgi:hypothetical protein